MRGYEHITKMINEGKAVFPSEAFLGTDWAKAENKSRGSKNMKDKLKPGRWAQIRDGRTFIFIESTHWGDILVDKNGFLQLDHYTPALKLGLENFNKEDYDIMKIFEAPPGLIGGLKELTKEEEEQYLIWKRVYEPKKDDFITAMEKGDRIKYKNWKCDYSPEGVIAIISSMAIDEVNEIVADRQGWEYWEDDNNE